MMIKSAGIFVTVCCLLLLTAVHISANQPGAKDVSIDQLEEQAFREAAVLVSPAVVRIETVGGLNAVNGQLTGTGATSGTIISEDGYVITSSFNFVSQPSAVFVTLADERKFPAKIISNDEIRKVTLLKIDAEKLPVAAIAGKSEIKVGRWSIALGRTYELEQPNVSIGIVSAVNRMWGKAIQTDAKISPANYGGPLIDIEGRIQGILVPLSPQSNEVAAGVEWYDSGIGFAIPMEDVMSRLELMKQGKDLKPGVMGITLEQKPGGQGKPVIKTVRAGSPADKGGLKVKDVIEAVNQKTVTKSSELKQELGNIYAGENVIVKVQRGQEHLELQMKLTDVIPPLMAVEMGILNDRKISEEGVKIREVLPGSPAEKAGLQKNDIIRKLGETEIKSVSSLTDAMEDLTVESKVEITYQRGDKTDLKTNVECRPAGAEIFNKLPSYAVSANGAEVKLPKTGLIKEKLVAFDKEYVLYVPEDYNPEFNYGMVVFLHPTGDPMEVDLLKAWKSGCNHRGVILLAPQSGKTTPWDSSDLEFITEAIKATRKIYKVADNRLVLHGYGDVSGLAASLSLRSPKEYPAVIVGPMSIKMTFGENSASRSVRFLLLAPEEKNLAERIDIQKAELIKAGYLVETMPTLVTSENYPEAGVIEKVILWTDSLDRY